MRLTAKKVSFRYAGSATAVLCELDFVAQPGSYWCIAGPNGSGKSTLLKLVSGLLPLEQMTGEVLWNDKPLRQWDRRALSREIGFVAGSLRSSFPVRVEDFVLQGRFSHSAFWARPSNADRKIALRCLERVGITDLRDRVLTNLSDGQIQLAMIARALAQEPKVLVLDEATANLDLGHQAKILGLLGELHRQGMTILLVSHDLNLAAEFCPNALWLRQGTSFRCGPMTETLTTDLMRQLYEVGNSLEIGKNPFTSRPKVFWR